MAKNDNLKDFLTDVADAIRAKKGTTDKINPQDFSAEIASIETSSGGSNTPVSKGDVTFYDYDGTILHSYTKDEFLALSAMPELPEREGLICQGWNYNFEDAVAYVSKYGILDVGATYITDDGKTRLYITIAAEGRMDVPLRLQQSVSNGVVVDWGDGSTETFTDSITTLTHTYGKIGDYVITLEVIDGALTLKSSTAYGIFASSMKVYGNMLKKVEVGSDVSIGSYAFNKCYSLSSVVIPNGVTSIGNNAFDNCCSLSSVVTPNGVTSIGSYAFNYCYSLSSVVIPNGVTSIGNNAFNNCYSLSSVVIPNGVTSIGNNAFYYCYSLSSVVTPNGVTSIGNNAFYYCTSVAFYDFRTHTSVPTLSNSSAFSGIASDCKIIVPDDLYDTWIAATNWSTFANNIIKKSDWDASQA